MADMAYFSPQARSSATRNEAAGVLPALLLAFPVAIVAAAATLLAGGGFLGALAAYGLGGSVAFLTGAVALAAPWRRLARAARRSASRFAAGAAAPAQFTGR